MRCEIERSSLLARAIHVSTQLINLPDIVIFAHTWHETRISRFNSCISFVLWKNVRRMMAKDHEEDVFDKQEDCRLTMEERREAKWGGLHIQIAPQAFCLESVRRTALKNCGVVLLVEQRATISSHCWLVGLFWRTPRIGPDGDGLDCCLVQIVGRGVLVVVAEECVLRCVAFVAQ